jgi:predicted alpha/beta hydrolase
LSGALIPAGAIDALLNRMPNTLQERQQLTASHHGGAIGHFGFFRETHRDSLWITLRDWLGKGLN